MLARVIANPLVHPAARQFYQRSIQCDENFGQITRVPSPSRSVFPPASSRLDAPKEPMPHPPVSTIRTVCVYCGSGPGTDRAFMEAARMFGEILARDGVGLVYG